MILAPSTLGGKSGMFEVYHFNSPHTYDYPFSF